MLVVGSSLARAFGIVGAAGLVRYRAKIDDPKDAGRDAVDAGRRPGVRRRPMGAGDLRHGVPCWRCCGASSRSSRRDARPSSVTVKAQGQPRREGRRSRRLLRRQHGVDFELRGPSRQEELSVRGPLAGRPADRRLSERDAAPTAVRRDRSTIEKSSRRRTSSGPIAMKVIVATRRRQSQPVLAALRQARARSIDVASSASTSKRS